jgi:hypothetical protein
LKKIEKKEEPKKKEETPAIKTDLKKTEVTQKVSKQSKQSKQSSLLSFYY